MDFQESTPVTALVTSGPATVAAGTTTTISNTGTINYIIRSKVYTKTAMTNVATPTTDYATGLAFPGVKGGGSVSGAYGNGTIVLIGLDHSGNLKACQGSIVPLDVSGNFINRPQYPGVPLDFCTIAQLEIKAGNTADAVTGWIFGTSNLATPPTGITQTFTDLAAMPDRLTF